ncbi:MAG: RNA polymerase sigma factor [Phycisphaerales bacterium]
MVADPVEIDRDDLAALHSGDGEAFARVYRARFGYTLAVARSATRLDESTCLDIVQDAWTRLVRSPPRCAHERQLDAWLRLAVLSAGRDAIRKEKRRRTREHASTNGRATHHSIQDAAEVDERLAWIAKELDTLDRETRAMLGLRFRTSMTLAQLGGLFEQRPGATDGRIGRALARLRTRAEEAFRE